MENARVLDQSEAATDEDLGRWEGSELGWYTSGTASFCKCTIYWRRLLGALVGGEATDHSTRLRENLPCIRAVIFPPDAEFAAGRSPRLPQLV